MLGREIRQVVSRELDKEIQPLYTLPPDSLLPWRPNTRKLVPQAQFASACGSPSASPSPSTVVHPTRVVTQAECAPNAHGPPCEKDSDCADVRGCLRCAHSGFCTRVPLASQWFRARHHRHHRQGRSALRRSVAECVPNTHGPKCQNDSDCAGTRGCLRCAHSGFCTATPLRLRQ